MKPLLIFLLIGLLCACSGQQSSVALNWYTRIDHAPGCGDRNVALIAGKDTLLCPLDEALFNGDSLVVRSQGQCYFFSLRVINDYKSLANFEKIDCGGFKNFITHHVGGWPHDPVDKPEATKI